MSMQEYLFSTSPKSDGEILVNMDEMAKDETKVWLNDTALMIRDNVNNTTVPKLSFYRKHGDKAVFLLSFFNRVFFMDGIATINIAFEVGDCHIPIFNEFVFENDEAHATVICKDSIDALQMVRLLIKYVEIPGVHLNLDCYADQHEALIKPNPVHTQYISSHDLCCPHCSKVIKQVKSETDLRDVFIYPTCGTTLNLDEHIPIEHLLDCTYYAYWYKDVCSYCDKGYLAFQVTLSRYFESNSKGFKTFFLSADEEYTRFNYRAANNKLCTSGNNQWIGNLFTTKDGPFWEHTFGPYAVLENDEENEKFALSVITQLWQEFLSILDR